MRAEIFCVRDMVADRYMEPFCALNVGSAIRGFLDICAEDAHPFNKHPHDYCLYHIGNFDGELGVLVPCDPHKVADGFVGMEDISHA